MEGVLEELVFEYRDKGLGELRQIYQGCKAMCQRHLDWISRRREDIISSESDIL